jgi:hydroxymethylbilane synthase
MTEVLTAATRGTDLAIAQTRIVISALKKVRPDIQIKIKKVATGGDRDKRTALWKLQTSGFFTSQVEDVLLAKKADFAVHSFKDLPTRQREGLTMAAVCQRQFAEDCLLAANSLSSIEELPKAAKVGTSSLRRIAQIKHLRKDLRPLSLIGNVTTRIRFLEEGKFDAIILARAGVERLGLTGKISLPLGTEQFIPAPAQGALVVQTRTNDARTNDLVAEIDDNHARTVTFAERQVLITMQCGCHAPVGAFARIDRDCIIIDAFISDLEAENFIRRKIAGPVAEAKTLAEKIASELLDAGGRKILEKLQRDN